MMALRINESERPASLVFKTFGAATLAVIIGTAVEVGFLVAIEAGQGALIILFDWGSAIFWFFPLAIGHRALIAKIWPKFVFAGTLAFSWIVVTTVSACFFALMGIDPFWPPHFGLAVHYGLVYGTVYTAAFWALLIKGNQRLVAPTNAGGSILIGLGICTGILLTWVVARIVFELY